MNEVETFYGLIEGTADALRVFELCRQGRLGRVRRRLHERERRLIRSGSVFVFDESESGIRRWTDGRLWSPSRILGNFLIYRELERRPAGAVDGRKDMGATTTGGELGEKPVAVVGRVMDRISSGPYSDSSWLTAPVLPEGGQDVPSSWSLGGGGGSRGSFGAGDMMIMGGSSLEDASPLPVDSSLLSLAPSSDQMSPPSVSSPPIFVVDPRQLWSSTLPPAATANPNASATPKTPSGTKRTRSLSDASNLASPLGPNGHPGPMAAAASFIGPNAVRLLQSKKLQGSGPPGSLRYTFKADGLVKKTLSAKIDGRTQHLICYFNEADFVHAHGGGPRMAAASTNQLMTELRRTPLPDDLILQQHFRKQPALHSQPSLEPSTATDHSGSSGSANSSVAIAATQRQRRHSMNWLGGGRPVQIYPRLESMNEGVSTTPSLGLGGSNGSGSFLEGGIEEWSLSSLALPHTQLASIAVAPPPSSSSSPSAFPPLQSDNAALADTAGAPPSTATIVDECIKMVLGEQSPSLLLMGEQVMLGSGNPAALGLAPCSDDPPLPIIDRPSSVFD